MGSAVFASAAGKWVSNCWVTDLCAAPPDISRAVCADSKSQSPRMLTILASKFQLVQDDMSKARSVRKDWEFVSKGTEISLGRFVSEYFTPLTLDSNTGVISDEDTTEIWGTVKETAIDKARRNKNKTSGEDSTVIDVREVERSF